MGYLEDRRSWKQFGKPKKVKEDYVIPKKSAKKIAEEKAEKEERGDGDSELQSFFKSVMKRMGDRCYECGAKVENKVYRYAILSICHILAKRDTMCPSVKTHPANWICLCPDHHTKFDNSKWEEIETWGCFPEIRDRLILVYPDLAIEERRFFPECVLKYMVANEPF